MYWHRLLIGELQKQRDAWLVMVNIDLGDLWVRLPARLLHIFTPESMWTTHSPSKRWEDPGGAWVSPRLPCHWLVPPSCQGAATHGPVQTLPSNAMTRQPDRVPQEEFSFSDFSVTQQLGREGGVWRLTCLHACACVCMFVNQDKWTQGLVWVRGEVPPSACGEETKMRLAQCFVDALIMERIKKSPF